MAGSPPASREHSKALTFTVREISESFHALTAGVSASFHTASSVFSSVLITIYWTRFKTVEESGDGTTVSQPPAICLQWVCGKRDVLGWVGGKRDILGRANLIN